MVNNLTSALFFLYPHCNVPLIYFFYNEFILYHTSYRKKYKKRKTHNKKGQKILHLRQKNSVTQEKNFLNDKAFFQLSAQIYRSINKN